MRRGVAVLGLSGVLLALVGCGPVDAGSAFKEQFDPFLAGRDAVVEHDISSQNTLPWSGTAQIGLTLEEGLSDDQIVEEILAIVSHQVDDPVRYSLTVRFPSPAGDGSPGVAAAGFEVPGPLDPETVRDATQGRIEATRALVALGSGPTRMGTQRSPFPMTSEADAFEVARELCERPDVASGFNEAVSIATGPVDVETGLLEDGARQTALLEHDFGEGCGDLDGLEELLDEVRDRGTVLSYDAATYAGLDPEPRLSVTVAPEVGTLTDLVRAAEADGIRLSVTSPRPTPAPSTSTVPPTP